MKISIEFEGSAEDCRFVNEVVGVLRDQNNRSAAGMIRSGAPIRYMHGGAAVTSLPVPLTSRRREYKGKAK